MNIIIEDQRHMDLLGKKLGSLLRGGEVIELIGDVGAGKTTFTKSIALGLGIKEPVQSPTFTISNRYEARDDLELAHYDFYRLHDAGIMESELEETIDLPNAITVIEWGDLVANVLPEDTLTIRITPLSDTSRKLDFKANGTKSSVLMEKIV